MDIREKIETTRIVSAIVSFDDMKAVAINTVRREAKIAADADFVSEADFDPAVGVVVKIAVKQTQDAPAPAPDADAAVSTPAVEAPIAPLGGLVPSIPVA